MSLILRALYHSAARFYYGWALNSIAVDHPDASFVVLRHAHHQTALDAFLRGGR